jgi:hypothetical protein
LYAASFLIATAVFVATVPLGGLSSAPTWGPNPIHIDAMLDHPVVPPIRVPATPLTWTELLSPEAPPNEFEAALTYDPVTQQALYFEVTPTGGLQWIWAYSSGLWTNDTPSGGPTTQGLRFVSAAYDPALGSVVVVGNPPAGNTQTWEYRGGVWSELSPPTEPEGIEAAGLTYDATNSSLLLLTTTFIGGSDHTLTWSLQGENWSQVSTSGAPPPLSGTMAFDNSTTSHRVVLFVSDFSPRRNETWTYDNGSWTNVTGVSGPEPPAAAAQATYDPSSGSVVLLSSESSPGNVSDSTWDYSNGTWSFVATPSAPRSVAGGLTFDGRDGFPLLVLPGSSLTTGQPSTEVWKFDRTAIGTPPVPRLSVTPTNPSAGETIHVVASAVGGFGVVGALVSILGPGCDVLQYGLGTYNCTPNSGGSGVATLFVTDQAGRVKFVTEQFNVTAPSLIPEWAWYPIAGAVLALIAATVVILVRRRRKDTGRRGPPPGDSDQSAR